MGIEAHDAQAVIDDLERFAERDRLGCAGCEQGRECPDCGNVYCMDLDEWTENDPGECEEFAPRGI